MQHLRRSGCKIHKILEIIVTKFFSPTNVVVSYTIEKTTGFSEQAGSFVF